MTPYERLAALEQRVRQAEDEINKSIDELNALGMRMDRLDPKPGFTMAPTPPPSPAPEQGYIDLTPGSAYDPGFYRSPPPSIRIPTPPDSPTPEPEDEAEWWRFANWLTGYDVPHNPYIAKRIVQEAIQRGLAAAPADRVGPDAGALQQAWQDGYTDGHAEGLRTAIWNLQELIDAWTAPAGAEGE